MLKNFGNSRPDRCLAGPATSMLLAVINHGLSGQALALKRAFAPHTPALAIDSGSALTSVERAAFDLALPNVYYSGLLNAVATASANLPADEPVFIWCSDVTAPDYERACALAADALARPDVGTYAPSAWYSPHRQMWNRRSGALRAVTFVDGFCFATRASLLRQLCPIDTKRNRLGWGLDVQLGYLTRHARLRAVVDDRLEVRHPQSTGYSRPAAGRERGAWQAQLPREPRWFHRLARHKLNKHPLTMRLILSFPW
jgi:hypothetical protein